jgi:hypothetical protein
MKKKREQPKQPSGLRGQQLAAVQGAGGGPTAGFCDYDGNVKHS